MQNYINKQNYYQEQKWNTAKLEHMKEQIGIQQSLNNKKHKLTEYYTYSYSYGFDALALCNCASSSYRVFLISLFLEL